MDDVVIKIDNVSKDFSLPSEKLTSLKSRAVHPFKKIHYKKQHALKNISLEIKRGEFFGIVGRNGSGKSTLLKLLAGIYQPTKGSISVSGKLVPFIELGVGFNPELSGRENVFLNGALLGFSEKEVAEMYDDIVEFAELGEFMEQKLKNYSSGMQVRLAFSMAIRAKADILLIDEVLAVGDADFQRKCYTYFKTLKAKGTTVVFISHDMSAVREYCDRATIIENNQIDLIGNTTKVADRYSKLLTVLSETDDNAQHERWGEKSLEFTDVIVKISKQHIEIRTSLKANSNQDAPIIGFRIRDAAGKEVLGSNTKLEHQKVPNIENGKEITVLWKFKNVLSDGKYSVDPAILLSDGITTADWWDGAANFIIKRTRRIPYAIDPGFDLQIVSN